MKWYELAQAELKKGIAEVPGSKDNNAILQYYRDVGVPQKHDEVAWCAAFVGSCLERAKIRSTRSLMARSYTSFGTKLEKPREGCIVVFWRESPKSGYGHVGFFVRQTKDYIYVLGGNQSNKISVAAYPKSRLLGYRWPPVVEEAQLPLSPTFDKAFSIVVPLEGGFTNHPRDPGGPTNMGVTAAEYATYLGLRYSGNDDDPVVAKLKDIPEAHAKDIFRRNYWETVQADKLPEAIAIFTFDCAILHGAPKAKKYLQEALGVTVDGDIGPKTLAAAKGSNATAVLNRFRDIRLRQLKQSDNWDVFGKGWAARVEAVLQDCLEMVPAPKAAPAAKAVLTEKEVPMPEVDTSTENLPKHWTQSLTVWGTIITFLSTVVPVIGPIFGLPITAEMIQAFGESVTYAIKAIGGVVGTTMTIYGRWRAAQPLAAATVKVRL